MMKKIVITLLIAITANVIFAQVPNIRLKNLSGRDVQVQEFIQNDGKPVILNFWATWCGPCLQELKAIAEVYEDWQNETGVKMVIVSIDDARTVARVRPMVNAQGWDFDVLLDVNSELRRAMNVQNPPHTFILNGDGEIVSQHVGYSPGSENKLIEEVRKLVAEQ
jgi:thiol-disulfide isomerase/thioredoxin